MSKNADELAHFLAGQGHNDLAAQQAQIAEEMRRRHTPKRIWGHNSRRKFESMRYLPDDERVKFQADLIAALKRVIAEQHYLGNNTVELNDIALSLHFEIGMHIPNTIPLEYLLLPSVNTQDYPGKESLLDEYNTLPQHIKYNYNKIFFVLGRYFNTVEEVRTIDTKRPVKIRNFGEASLQFAMDFLGTQQVGDGIDLRE